MKYVTSYNAYSAAVTDTFKRYNTIQAYNRARVVSYCCSWLVLYVLVARKSTGNI